MLYRLFIYYHTLVNVIYSYNKYIQKYDSWHIPKAATYVIQIIKIFFMYTLKQSEKSTYNIYKSSMLHNV